MRGSGVRVRVCVEGFGVSGGVQGNMLDTATSTFKRQVCETGNKLDGEGRAVWNRTVAVKCLAFTASHATEFFIENTYTHRREVNKDTQVNTHKRGSDLKTRRTQPKTKHSCINKRLSSYIFVLTASCICTMHLFSVLPCSVRKEKHSLYYSDNILWSVFLSISVLCSNIFSHAAIGQRMRH